MERRISMLGSVRCIVVADIELSLPVQATHVSRTEMAISVGVITLLDVGAAAAFWLRGCWQSATPLAFKEIP